MTGKSFVRGAAKTLVVILATAAGAAAGALLGITYVNLTMPYAGLEGILPVGIAGLTGSAVGALLGLGVIFKLPPLRAEYLFVTVAATVALLLLGVFSYVAAPTDASDPWWVYAARTGLPLGLLIALVAGASRLFGREAASAPDSY